MPRKHVPAGGPLLGPHVIRAAAAAPVWEADIVPMAAQIDDDPAARPGVVIVVAGEAVVYVDMMSRPPAEPEAVAEVLSEAVARAGRSVGSLPEAVATRDPEVRLHLAPRLEAREMDLAPEGPLTSLTPAVRLLLEGLEVGWPPVSSPETWQGWGVSEARIAALFEATAGYARARPWSVLDDTPPLLVLTPGGDRWTVSVLGAAGRTRGIALYSEPFDFARALDDEAGEAWSLYRGRIIALTLGSRDELPRRMQREVISSGWEVAAPDAYPLLMALVTPGGGISARDWDDLVAILGILPTFVAAAEDEILSGRAAGWEDPVNGLIVLAAGEENHAPIPERLAPGGPQGPGADPEAALAPVDPDVVADPVDERLLYGFVGYLLDQGLADSTIRRHAENVQALLGFLGSEQMVPLRAMHEFDFRCFLHDWVHRESGLGRTRLRSLPASMKHFLTFVSQSEGVHFPWAWSILSDRSTFRNRMESCPRTSWGDPRTARWLAELTADLFARVLLPDGGLGDDQEWSADMTFVEWDLRRQLQRRWLIWRDEIIRGGTTRPESVADALLDRQREWERTPQSALADRTPLDVIAEAQAGEAG